MPTVPLQVTMKESLMPNVLGIMTKSFVMWFQNLKPALRAFQTVGCGLKVGPGSLPHGLQECYLLKHYYGVSVNQC